MENKAPRTVSPERAATAAEIEKAIAGLTDADWYRLRAFADRRAVVLQEKTRGRDLLGEAFERLLLQSRKWDTKVEFTTFLYGAMRSIANKWLRESNSAKAPILASSLIIENDDGRITNPVEEFSSTKPDAAQSLVYREVLDRLANFFADDDEEQMVWEGFRDGLDPPAIRILWEFSQKQYNAIIVRMRRKMKRAGIENPMETSHVQ